MAGRSPRTPADRWRRGAFMAVALVLVACRPAATDSGAPGGVSLENWRAHPRIVEIRAIYDAVQRARAGGRGTTTARRFAYDSPRCEATYPVKAVSLWRDPAGRARAYVLEQIISHGDTMRVERYYDTDGRLRFVLMRGVSGETRIYLGTDGAVIWAVSRENGTERVDPYEPGDWPVRPATAAEAVAEFAEAGGCPELAPRR